MQLLAQISSPNVCVVKGYCAHEAGPRLSTGERRQERLLVFEQPYNGPLSDHLFGNRYLTYLDWRTRIDIALGAARGLLYIHDRAPLQIVYKDFCASNVLLDRDFAPRLAGYGLSVTATPSSSFKPVSKRVPPFLGLGFHQCVFSSVPIYQSTSSLLSFCFSVSVIRVCC